MAGLMEFAQTPDFWNWASGVAGGLTRAGQGRGYDISQANQQLFQGFKDRSQMEQMRGLMDQGDYTPQQRGLMDSIRDPRMLQQILMQQAFPQQGKRQIVKAADGFQYDVNTGERAFPGVEMAASRGASPAVWQQKMEANIAAGMDPEIALGVATGTLKLDVDALGRRVVTDMKTGKPYDYGEGASASPAHAPVAPPDETLYENLGETTGLGSALASASTAILGQIPLVGEWFTYPETVQRRQELTAASGGLARALSVNSKYPVSEINRVIEQVGILPDMLEDPVSAKARAKGIATYLGELLKGEIAASQNMSLPADRQTDALTKIHEITNFLRILGVPEDGEEGASGPPSEGTIHKNYQTGEEIIWNGSAWVPHG